MRTPGITRWKSLHDSIKCILQVRGGVNKALGILGKNMFTDEDFQFLEEYVRVLEPIAEGLNFLQGEKYAYYGIYLPTLLSIECKLKKVSSDSLAFCSPLLCVVKQQLNTRFDEVLSCMDSQTAKGLSTAPRPIPNES